MKGKGKRWKIGSHEKKEAISRVSRMDGRYSTEENTERKNWDSDTLIELRDSLDANIAKNGVWGKGADF